MKFILFVKKKNRLIHLVPSKFIYTQKDILVNDTLMKQSYIVDGIGQTFTFALSARGSIWSKYYVAIKLDCHWKRKKVEYVVILLKRFRTFIEAFDYL